LLSVPARYVVRVLTIIQGAGLLAPLPLRLIFRLVYLRAFVFKQFPKCSTTSHSGSWAALSRIRGINNYRRELTCENF